MKKALLGLLIVFFAAFGWYLVVKSPTPSQVMGDNGSYPYSCDNGMHFTISPAEDLSWVAIYPGENATFPQQTLSYHDNVSGMKYWSPTLSFVGAGEEILLSVHSATTSCNPIPSTTEAPWNWGDPGEGAGITQNLSVIVANSIAGTWQSTDDPRFRRTFKSDGTFVDTYNGTQTARGLWNVFTRDNAPEVSFEVESGRSYIQLADSDGGIFYFQVISLSPAALSMIYMDRGGVLNFAFVEE